MQVTLSAPQPLSPCPWHAPLPPPSPSRWGPPGGRSPAAPSPGQRCGHRGMLWLMMPCGDREAPCALLSGAAAEIPCLSPASCSNGVPVPCHGDGCGLPRGALTGPRTRRLQHVPGCAPAATHPHLRRVSTWGWGGGWGLGGGMALPGPQNPGCCPSRGGGPASGCSLAQPGPLSPFSSATPPPCSSCLLAGCAADSAPLGTPQKAPCARLRIWC